MAEDAPATPQSTAPPAAATVPAKPWYLNDKIDFFDDHSVKSGMAAAGVTEMPRVIKRGLNETIETITGRSLDASPDPAEATPAAEPEVVETPAAPVETPPAEPAPAPAEQAPAETVEEPAPAEVPPAAAESPEVVALREQLAEAQGKLEQLNTAKQDSEIAAERKAMIAGLVEEYGEDHHITKLARTLDKQITSFETKINMVEQRADQRSAAAEQRSDAAFHKAQMTRNPILNEILDGKELNPKASPEAALVAYFNDKRLEEADKGKIARTREQHYALVEADMKAARADLAAKHYPAPKPEAKPAVTTVKPTTKPVVKKAPTGIQTMNDLPGGATEVVKRGKGITETNPQSMSKTDFASLMDQLTR